MKIRGTMRYLALAVGAFSTFAAAWPMIASAGEIYSQVSDDVRPEQETVGVTFDHSVSGAKLKSVVVKSGQTIQVTVQNTCADSFDLKVEQVSVEPPPTGGTADNNARTPGCVGDDVLQASIAYDSQYSAYIVKVVPKAGVKLPVMTREGKHLDAVDYIVHIDTQESPWSTKFSGGATISSLTNPKYSLEQGTGANSGSYTVRRDRNSEDALTLGFAAFIHVSHVGWQLPTYLGSPSLAISFGLGVNTGSRVNYYPGLSLEYGELVITGGANIGSIDSLPAGLRESETTTQANVLSNLPTRNATGAFFALSWTFLGSSVKQVFEGKISQPQSK